HGDESVGRRGASRKRFFAKLLAIVVIDGSLLAALILFWYTHRTFTHPDVVAWAIFGSILPDALQGLAEITDNYFLVRYQRFHHLFHVAMHPRWSHVRLPLYLGLPIQILFSLILLLRTVS
ncbi:hypothetical protein HY625_00285, partial [Candidatus Uhrbacteria bacterium]|nr:hypothetical protein [Candidatus Uhrbacteria bacterium]